VGDTYDEATRRDLDIIRNEATMRALEIELATGTPAELAYEEALREVLHELELEAENSGNTGNEEN
jgi:hypothetical protein